MKDFLLFISRQECLPHTPRQDGKRDRHSFEDAGFHGCISYAEGGSSVQLLKLTLMNFITSGSAVRQ